MLLGVNVDHIATLREARKTTEPDPVYAAILAEMGGADQITIHLREDRRHIQDRDVRLIRETVQTRLNLEMAITEEMVGIALATRPYSVCLVPEKREEVTTEGGLNLLERSENFSQLIRQLQEGQIKVSLFIDPTEDNIKLAHKFNVDSVELHTGAYANADSEAEIREELSRIEMAAKLGSRYQLNICAGHGLTYRNVRPIAKISEIGELNIGHSIIARAAFVGMAQAVRDMKELIRR